MRIIEPSSKFSAFWPVSIPSFRMGILPPSPSSSISKPPMRPASVPVVYRSLLIPMSFRTSPTNSHAMDLPVLLLCIQKTWFLGSRCDEPHGILTYGTATCPWMKKNDSNPGMSLSIDVALKWSV